jgi:hypothetical protein
MYTEHNQFSAWRVYGIPLAKYPGRALLRFRHLAFAPGYGTMTGFLKSRALLKSFTKFFVLSLVAMALFASRPARAEQNSAGVYDWIMNLGQVTFNAGGGAFLPTGVLNSMRYGQISPIMQFVTANHIMNSAIANALRPQLVPLQRDPFLVAQKKFTYGLCMIKKGWQNAVAFVTLSTIQQNNSFGGGDQQIAQVLISSFQKDPACDGTGGGGLDPNLLRLAGVGQ